MASTRNTTAVFVDLQQAYDQVWRKGLLMKMVNIGIHGKMLQWIQSFLTNRTIKTTVEGATSSKRTLEEGLPQGSALTVPCFSSSFIYFTWLRSPDQTRNPSLPWSPIGQTAEHDSFHEPSERESQKTLGTNQEGCKNNMGSKQRYLKTARPRICTVSHEIRTAPATSCQQSDY